MKCPKCNTPLKHNNPKTRLSDKIILFIGFLIPIITGLILLTPLINLLPFSFIAFVSTYFLTTITFTLLIGSIFLSTAAIRASFYARTNITLEEQSAENALQK